MANPLADAGLQRYIAGDVHGAVRLWLQALSERPEDAEVGQFIRTIRAVSPEVITQVESNEAGLAPRFAPPADAPWAGEALTAPGELTSSGPALALVACAAMSEAASR